jgi:hypothetical protein
MAQSTDGRSAFLADVDHILGQRADDAVPAGINPADFVGVTACGFDQATGGRIDDCGYPAGLCVEGVFLAHKTPWR